MPARPPFIIFFPSMHEIIVKTSFYYYMIGSKEMIQYNEAIQLISSIDPVILMISKAHCEPCHRIKSNISILQSICPNIAIYEIDLESDIEMDWILSIGVTKFPTFLYIQNGRIQDRITSGYPDQVRQWIHRNYGSFILSDDF